MTYEQKRLCLVGSDIVLSDVRIHEGDVSGWVDNYYEKDGQYHCFMTTTLDGQS